MQKIEQMQEIETLTTGTSGTERPVSEIIGGALVRVALALVIIVSLLVISYHAEKTPCGQERIMWEQPERYQKKPF